MAERTNIQWADATFNPWWGCRKVSPGCDNCYAERDAHRFSPKLKLWEPGSPRREFGERHWTEPYLWAQTATAEKKRWRVFCASMADVFDNEAPGYARDRLWMLIADTVLHLDWLVLTKRIGNAKAMLPPDWGDGYLNVWLGATVVNQEEADRDIPKLLATPAEIRFVSVEPMLGPVDLRPWLEGGHPTQADIEHPTRGERYLRYGTPLLDWVIVGGESGPKARPLNLQWVRDIVEQCQAAGVAVFVKQLGAKPYDVDPANPERTRKLKPRDRKGGDILEFPEELRVRQFPLEAR